MEIDSMKLSDILETYECIEEPNEHDKEQMRKLKNMISEYGNITLRDYKMIKFSEITFSPGTPRYITEAEQSLFLNHTPPNDGVETASFEDMMCNAGLW